jgi:hypothetical protein
MGRIHSAVIPVSEKIPGLEIESSGTIKRVVIPNPAAFPGG